MAAGILWEARPADEVGSGYRLGMAIGRSISARVPYAFEKSAGMQLSGQTKAWNYRSSSMVAGRIGSDGKYQAKRQYAGGQRKTEQTLSQLKDPKWKQFVKKIKGFMKRLGNDAKRPANPSTATLFSVMEVRPAPVPGVAPPRIPIWQRRNLPPLHPLNISKERPSRSRSTRFFGMG